MFFNIVQERSSAELVKSTRPSLAVKSDGTCRGIAKGHLSDPLFKTSARADSQRRRSRLHINNVKLVRGLSYGKSVMPNRIDIDHRHSRAILREIGERLWGSLREEPELPENLRKQVDRLNEFEDQSPSIVPRMD